MDLDCTRYAKLENFLNDSYFLDFRGPTRIYNIQKKFLAYISSRDIMCYKKQMRCGGISTILRYVAIWNLIFNDKNVAYCNHNFNGCMYNTKSIKKILCSLFGDSILERLIHKTTWANIDVLNNKFISSTTPHRLNVNIDRRNTVLIIDEDARFEAIGVCLKLNPILYEYHKSIVIIS